VGCTIFMNRLRIGFEKSTFVKRLKAASRRQLDVAIDLNNMEGFSLKDGEVNTQSDLERLAEREISESKTISTLLQDMAAYTDRHPAENYSRVLAEMQAAVVSSQLRDMAELINANFVGQSTIEAEFWADTLDRCAEKLVDSLLEGAPPSRGRNGYPAEPAPRNCFGGVASHQS